MGVYIILGTMVLFAVVMVGLDTLTRRHDRREAERHLKVGGTD